MCCPGGQGLSYSRASLESLARQVPAADSPANPATLVPSDRVRAKPFLCEAAATATLAEVKRGRHRGCGLECPCRLKTAVCAPPSPRGGDWGPELTAWAAPPLRGPRSSAHTTPSSRRSRPPPPRPALAPPQRDADAPTSFSPAQPLLSGPAAPPIFPAPRPSTAGHAPSLLLLCSDPHLGAPDFSILTALCGHFGDPTRLSQRF